MALSTQQAAGRALLELPSAAVGGGGGEQSGHTAHLCSLRDSKDGGVLCGGCCGWGA